MNDHEHYLNLALTEAGEAIHKGGGPFGAVLVTVDGAIYKGADCVLTTNDPTAHAEMTAIRLAAATEQTYDLSGSTLYSSSEPCPMCLTAALWARIPRIYYAATAEQAATAGFDDASFYRQLSKGVSSVTDAQVTHLALPQANAPFEEWGNYEGRVDF